MHRERRTLLVRFIAQIAFDLRNVSVYQVHVIPESSVWIRFLTQFAEFFFVFRCVISQTGKRIGLIAAMDIITTIRLDTFRMLRLAVYGCRFPVHVPLIAL